MRAFLLVLLLGAGFARAHDPGLSSVVATPGADAIEVTATFAPADIVPFANPDDEAARRALAPRTVTLATEAGPLSPEVVGTAHDVAGNNVEFRLRFPAADGPLVLTGALVDQLALGHRQLAVVRDAAGQPVAEQLLRAGSASLAIPGVAAAPAPAPSFAGWVWLGVEHILIGYDHLLFLAALLLVAVGFMDALKIITCFTVAHSLTLALATLGIVEVAGRFVEVVIAASIVYVGIENIVTRGHPRARYIITFVFGLIHGLGFASVLGELGVGEAGVGVVMPLLGFNLGVELGQVAVAAVVFPILMFLRRQPAWVQRGVPVGSALIAAAGAWWLFERLSGA